MEKEEHLTDDETLTLKRQVENESRRTFYIKDCPEKTWRDFSLFCKEEHKNDYALGLDALLKMRKLDVKNTILMNMILENKEEINKIKKVNKNE